MKIVLDTNIFISGIFWKGHSHQIIKLAEENKFEIYATVEILKEIISVLKRNKFNYLFEEAATTREKIFQKIFEFIKICIPKIKINIITMDPSDNKFLSCALACGASFIISGDNHLLKLKSFKGVCIISSREFLKIHHFIKYP